MTAPTREQSVLGWAIHCDLIDSRDIDQELVKSILEKLREFSDLAYAAGQAAEREACAQVCENVLAIWVDDSNKDVAAPLLRECAADIRARGGK